MNQRVLISIIILAGIGSIGSVLAYSGSISAAQGNFNNVLVTGTCSGCGGSEADYTTYSLVLNQTITGTNGGAAGQVQIANDKGVIGNDGAISSFAVTPTGTVIKLGTAKNSYSSFNLITQSEAGKYKALIFTNNTITIIKNNAILQTITLDTTSSFLNPSDIVINFSPSGKYLAILGPDAIISQDRLQIWQGS